jgi:hypothetical protein
MTNGAIETVLWPGLQALEPSTKLGGILARKPGYHNSRDHLPAHDKSVRQFAIDRQGPADLGSAIDWTFPEAQGDDPDYRRIRKYSSRLLAAGRGDDPRMKGVREFFGQTDSDRGVEGWDFTKKRPSTSSNLTHNWHIHISIHRGNINDAGVMHAVLSVLSGQPLAAWQANPHGEIDMPLDNTDVNKILDRMAVRLRDADDALSIAMTAAAWKYAGGGLGGARTSLAALADTQIIKAQTAALVSAVGKMDAVDEAALGRTIAANIVGPLKDVIVAGLPDSDLTTSDVERAVTAALVKAGLTGPA